MKIKNQGHDDQVRLPVVDLFSPKGSPPALFFFFKKNLRVHLRRSEFYQFLLLCFEVLWEAVGILLDLFLGGWSFLVQGGMPPSVLQWIILCLLILLKDP